MEPGISKEHRPRLDIEVLGTEPRATGSKHSTLSWRSLGGGESCRLKVERSIRSLPLAVP